MAQIARPPAHSGTPRTQLLSIQYLRGLAALSVLAALPLPVIEKILSAHSAKGIVALIWKAKLSMGFAVRVQTILARLPAAQMLKPRADGGFPLSYEALEWQIGFFTDMAMESGGGRSLVR